MTEQPSGSARDHALIDGPPIRDVDMWPNTRIVRGRATTYSIAAAREKNLPAAVAYARGASSMAGSTMASANATDA